MSKSSGDTTIPRAMIHKRVLDAAADQPDASMETLASTIPSATTDLVERVLDEYGDPATEESGAADGDSGELSETTTSPADELSDIQYEVLQAIYHHPEKSQRDLADLLDVSSATISNRANSIPGFSWEDRQEFAEATLDSPDPIKPEVTNTMATNDTVTDSTISALEERVESLESDRSEQATTNRLQLNLENTEIAQKVIHACFNSELITEDEELVLLKGLVS